MAERIGVVGAGVMGSGIAQVLAVSGCEVVCYDVAPGALERAARQLRTSRYGLDGAVARGKLTVAEADAAEARITFSSELAEAVSVDVVVEAVPEDLDLKVELFRTLDGIAPTGTILASNSSGFPITVLAAATARPELVIGWHWASPVVAMALAEIVRTPQTADAVVARICALAAAAGKNPVVVKDQPATWGYVANRIYARARAEADAVVAEGVATPEEVDQLMMDAFRWPSGPFGMVNGAKSGWD
jgi:3-hydroxybutyryl-CoA dehydrogenase/3-hydroxyacyl-CoA dehydrogenase